MIPCAYLWQIFIYVAVVEHVIKMRVVAAVLVLRTKVFSIGVLTYGRLAKWAGPCMCMHRILPPDVGCFAST